MNKQYSKRNLKLYPLYKMLSWDLLFYYAISLLFLTDQKNLSASEVLFADSFYLLFKSIFQIPSIVLIDKIGKRNSVIFANVCISIYVLLVIGCTGLGIYILANIILSFGYVVKGTCESNILYDSIPNSDSKRKIFAKLDGKGTSLYYIFDSVTAIASGFLYSINAYIPMIICLIISILSIVLSYLFEHTNLDNKIEEEYVTPASYLKDIFSAFKYILHSRRLRALILFNAIFAGLFPLLSTYRRSIYNDLNIPSEYIGIIFAVFGVIAGISSSRANKIHKKHKNKTLSFLGLPTTFSIILSGIFVALDFPFYFMIFMVLLSFAVQYINKGPYYTLIKQYLSSFSTSDMRIKIDSAKTLIEGIVGAILSFIGSFFLEITSTANACILIGCISTLGILFILEYMRTRVGLKPEEYSKRDINYVETK